MVTLTVRYVFYGGTSPCGKLVASGYFEGRGEFGRGIVVCLEGSSDPKITLVP